MLGELTVLDLARLFPMLAIVVLPILGGCRGAGPPEQGGRSAAEQFLEQVRSGQHDPAWQSTSTEFKSIMGLENLRDLAAEQPALGAPAEYVATSTFRREGLDLAECTFRATPAKNGKPLPARTIRVLLASDREGWKVQHLAIE